MTCRAAGCPHPITGETVPATLGHEFSGTVTEIATEGSDGRLKVGSRVCMYFISSSSALVISSHIGDYSEPIISCLECRPCLEGNRPLCEKGIGFFG